MLVESSKPAQSAITTQRAGRLLIVAHGQGAPSDHQWGDMLGHFAEPELDRLRVLVFTEGGGPTHAQQLQLSRVLGRKSRTLSVAVVSDSIGVRFMASALALFLSRIRTFRASELEQAYAHLQLDAEETRAARDYVASSRPTAKQRTSW